MSEKRSLIIGASGGIGRALQSELTARGWEVTALSRSEDGLDVTDEASVAQHLGRLKGPYHLVLIATGALTSAGHEPEKAVKEVTPEALAGQFTVNALGPMLVLKHALPLLPRNEAATVAALSARVGSIGDNQIGGWHSYRASKAALNQLFHGAAIELKRTHKKATVLMLHPGTVATPFTEKYAGRHKTTPPEEAARNLIDVALSKGPGETGRFFDYAGREVPW